LFFDEVWHIVNNNFFDESFNGNDWNKIYHDYEAKLASGADEHLLAEKMIKKLGDKYTRILDKATYEGLWKYDAIGVGVLFESSDEGGMVVASSPISGSSGAAAKLAKGDKVYSINGQSTAGMTAIALLDLMSNDNSGSLSLEVGRGRADGGLTGRQPAAASTVMPALARQHPDSGDLSEQHEKIVLTRSKQKAVNPVTFSTKTAANGLTVGYIKLADFNSEAVEGLRQALGALEPAVDEYVLDLRGNTGGGFQVRVERDTASCAHVCRSRAKTHSSNTRANTPSPFNYDPNFFTFKPLTLTTVRVEYRRHVHG
jgi:carboxyl-terminal processing protease